LIGDNMMGIRWLASIAILACASTGARAASVSVVENFAQNYVDLFYTVTPGGDFTNWDLRVTPPTGSILDPNPHQRNFNTASGGPIPIDTFVNTVFSSIGAGPASYVFIEYHPGSAFPPVPPQPPPTAGASPPNPDELNWSIFDTATGDGNIAGFFPYHMARIVFSPGGHWRITAHFFDTTNAGIGEEFTFISPLTRPDPEVPEPSSALIAIIASVGLSFPKARPSSPVRDSHES
jgi:hypothetical protein